LSYASLLLVLTVIFLILKYAGWLAILILLLSLTVNAVDCIAKRLSSLTHLSKRLCAASVLLISLALLCSAGALAVTSLISECRELLLSLSEGRGQLIIFIDSLLLRVEELQSLLSPFSEGDGSYISSTVHSLINKATVYLLARAGELATSLIEKTGSIICISVIFTISAVWLSIDLDGIKREISRFIPYASRKAVSSFIRRVQKLVTNYVLAHIILFALTFIQTYIGLLLMRVPFAIALASLVSLVDILPLLGASAVLLPAALISAISGRFGLCLGFLALLAVLYATRQIAQPLVVGKKTGTHPFLSFISTFAGLYFFGPSGAIIIPIVIAVIKHELIGKKDGWVPGS
jgi:predicted PurR-regulated permease PerM